MKASKTAVNGVIASLILSFGLIAVPPLPNCAQQPRPRRYAAMANRRPMPISTTATAMTGLSISMAAGLRPMPISTRLPRGYETPGAERSYWRAADHRFSEPGFQCIIGHAVLAIFTKGSIRNIDGKAVYFHGRKIVENVIDLHKNQPAGADRLVFAGYSAGAIGLLNADLIAQFKDPYVIADNFGRMRNRCACASAGPRGPGSTSRNLSMATCPTTARARIGVIASRHVRNYTAWHDKVFQLEHRRPLCPPW